VIVQKFRLQYLPSTEQASNRGTPNLKPCIYSRNKEGTYFPSCPYLSSVPTHLPHSALWRLPPKAVNPALQFWSNFLRLKLHSREQAKGSSSQWLYHLSVLLRLPHPSCTHRCNLLSGWEIHGCPGKERIVSFLVVVPVGSCRCCGCFCHSILFHLHCVYCLHAFCGSPYYGTNEH